MALLPLIHQPFVGELVAFASPDIFARVAFEPV
jgi:hypothetical protein